MCDLDEKDRALLRQKLADLRISLTPKDEFDKRFKDYVANWRELTEP